MNTQNHSRVIEHARIAACIVLVDAPVLSLPGRSEWVPFSPGCLARGVGMSPNVSRDTITPSMTNVDTEKGTHHEH
jgi:hypothetical protein